MYATTGVPPVISNLPNFFEKINFCGCQLKCRIAIGKINCTIFGKAKRYTSVKTRPKRSSPSPPRQAPRRPCGTPSPSRLPSARGPDPPGSPDSRSSSRHSSSVSSWSIQSWTWTMVNSVRELRMTTRRSPALMIILRHIEHEVASDRIAPVFASCPTR